MINVSNLLSLLRAPLAFAFLSENQTLRCVAIILAMLTDCMDGYFARRFRNTSQLGAVLDPLMDKFFVVFLFIVFILEGNLTPLQMAAMLGRDFAVVIFATYLYFAGEWGKYFVRAIWSGKVVTSFQFFVLMALTFHYAIPPYVFVVFVVLGAFALLELYMMDRPSRSRQLETGG